MIIVIEPDKAPEVILPASPYNLLPTVTVLDPAVFQRNVSSFRLTPSRYIIESQPLPKPTATPDYYMLVVYC